MADLRLFVAVPVDAPTVAAARRYRRDLGESASPLVRWVADSNLHVTIRFLGGTPEALVPSIGDAVGASAACIGGSASDPTSAGVELELGPMGAFPSARRPGTVWIEVIDRSGTLTRLHDELERELAGFGFAPDNRRFHPHVTIGHVRRRATPAQLRTVALALRSGGSSGHRFVAREVCLMQSRLTPRGAEYSRLAIHRLA